MPILCTREGGSLGVCGEGTKEEGGRRMEIHPADGLFYSSRITPSFSLFHLHEWHEGLRTKKSNELCDTEREGTNSECDPLATQMSEEMVYSHRSPWIKSVCMWCEFKAGHHLAFVRRNWPFHDEMPTGTWWNLNRASGLCVFIDLSTWTTSPITVSSGQLSLPGNKSHIRARGKGMWSLCLGSDVL